MPQEFSPLRIVHISPSTLKIKGGAFMHNVGAKITNGLIRLGHHVVHVSDRDLARQLSPFGSRKLGTIQANRFLPDLIKTIKPDLLMLGHADVLWADTLAGIRTALPAMKVAQWNVDPLVEDDNVRRINGKVRLCDATFVTTAGPLLDQFRAPGRIVGYMPNPSDPSIERSRNFERDAFSYDLICLVHGADFARQVGASFFTPVEIAAKLSAALPQVKLGFPIPGSLRPGGTLIGERYDKVQREARMGLNLSRRNDVYLYSSDRMAHYVGNGLLTLVDRGTGFGDLFGEDELGFYSSLDELIECVGLYARDDARRREIARKGWAHYHQMFDCRRVAHFMLGAMGLMPRLEGCEWDFTLAPSRPPVPITQTAERI